MVGIQQTCRKAKLSRDDDFIVFSSDGRARGPSRANKPAAVGDKSHRPTYPAHLLKRCASWRRFIRTSPKNTLPRS